MQSGLRVCLYRCLPRQSSSRKILIMVMMAIMAALQSGCATIMFQFKIDPHRTIEEIGSASFSYIGQTERYIYLATGDHLYRFDSPAGLSDFLTRQLRRDRPPAIAVGREGLREYRARIELVTTDRERPYLYLLKRGKLIEAAPSGMMVVDIPGVENVTLYREQYRSIAKRGVYRTFGLVAGVGIDHLIISQPWSPEKRVLVELWVGYGIGCLGVSGNSFC